MITKHRVNNSKNLNKLNINYGVEIDLRSYNKDIYLHHDPFKGEKNLKIGLRNITIS